MKAHSFFPWILGGQMSDSSDNRRAHSRLNFPIDAKRLGLVETPLELYDISAGGCFINDFHNSPAPGKSFDIRIELPYEDPVRLRAVVVHDRPGFGYAVRFVDVPDETRQAIERSMRRVRADGSS
jgi:hypothetical protein